MSIINLKERKINAKIVYYGTALGGKTTSLKYVHRVIDPAQNTELVSLNTERDRTLFFDFLPIALGRIAGFDVNIQGFTVPGQVKYNLTRKYVLTGADAVVFVVDSCRSQLDNNVASLVNLKENLLANGLRYGEIPLVIQYNKRDLEDLTATKELEALLNDRGVPQYETVATEGRGVFEAFVEVSRRMLDHIADQYRLPGRRIAFGDALVESLGRRLKAAEAAGAVGDGVVSMPKVVSADAAGLVKLGADEDMLPASEELLKKAVDSNIEIARLYSEVNEVKNRLRARVSELTTLHEAGKTLTSVLDVDELLRTVLDGATRCLGTECGSILLLNREETGLIEKVVNGFLWDPLGQCLGPDESPQAILGPATSGDGLLATPDEGQGLLEAVRKHEERVTALVAAPLVHKGRTLGLITAYFLEEGVEGISEKLRFLSSLASHASVALENARLVERIEEFNRNLERTVKERTAELRQAYEELKELDRLKDHFLSSMSHELLTPLTSIRSFSEILLGSEAEEREATFLEFLGIINKESDRLTERLGMILDLSQLEGGKVSLENEAVDLGAIVRELMAAAAPDFEEKGVVVQFDDPGSPLEIPGDAAWLTKAVKSLLGNALKFSDEGGNVAVTWDADAQSIRLTVADEGPGIAPEFRSVIFERFKQIGELLTDKPTGVGLGLPLAHLVVTAHGGSISVAGEPGKGSAFTIELPRSAEVPAVP